MIQVKSDNGKGVYLLNELRKREKMRGLSSILSLFHEFNKFNNTGAHMLDSIYHMTLKLLKNHIFDMTGPRSAVGNVSGYRCVSDCRSRGREFDPGPVPYFRGD